MDTDEHRCGGTWCLGRSLLAHVIVSGERRLRIGFWRAYPCPSVFICGFDSGQTPKPESCSSPSRDLCLLGSRWTRFVRILVCLGWWATAAAALWAADLLTEPVPGEPLAFRRPMASLCLADFPDTVPAAAPMGRREPWFVPNLQLSVGVGWLADLDVSEFRVVTDVAFGPDRVVDLPAQSALEFDPALEFELALGGRLVKAGWLSWQFETGVWLSRAHLRAGDIDFEGDSWHVPVLLNLVVAPDVHPRLTPFVGVGGGAFFSQLGFEPRTIFTGYTIDEGSAALGAYQAFAGVRYQFADHWAASLRYRFLRTTSPEWAVNNESFNVFGGGTEWHLDASPLTAHSLLLAVELDW